MAGGRRYGPASGQFAVVVQAQVVAGTTSEHVQQAHSSNGVATGQSFRTRSTPAVGHEALLEPGLSFAAAFSRTRQTGFDPVPLSVSPDVTKDACPTTGSVGLRYPVRGSPVCFGQLRIAQPVDGQQRRLQRREKRVAEPAIGVLGH